MRPAQEQRAPSVSDVLLHLPQEMEAVRGPLARLCSTRAQASEFAEELSRWRGALLQGHLPSEGGTWPPEPLRAELRAACHLLELPQFIAENPRLVDVVLLNVLEAVERWQTSHQGLSKDGNTSPKANDGMVGRVGEHAVQDHGMSASGGISGARVEALASASQQPAGAQDNLGVEKEVKAGAEGEVGRIRAHATGPEAGDETEAAALEAVAAARTAARAFAGQWVGVLESARWPQLASWDTDAAEGPAGAGSLSQQQKGAAWRAQGWRHLVELRKLLGRLPMIQDLVRRMGRRGGARAPLRRAPAQRERRHEVEGAVKSPRAPTETTGVTRSDGHLLLLPSELSLLAYAGASPARPAAAGARALHRLRRAEAALLSYERSAWAAEPAEVLRRRELRPAAERGPMICLLDTSRSMAGRKEAVAKAALLEVLRRAEAERRPCAIYAFSGPDALRELVLPPPPLQQAHWESVLRFFAGTFGGGTDLQAPLAAALARCASGSQWLFADVLLVSDGQVPATPPGLQAELQRLRRENGLRLFGLLVLEVPLRPPAAFTELCDEWHRFEALGRIPLRWRPSEEQLVGQ